MITILTHLRTEAYQSIDHFWGVPYETQNKVRLPSKAIMDTHLSGWLRCGWAINRGVCPGLLQTSPGALVLSSPPDQVLPGFGS